MDRINEIITTGSKDMRGPAYAALVAACLATVGTLGNIITMFVRRSGGGISNRIREMDNAWIESSWKTRTATHGFTVFFDLLETMSYFLYIWVFDGIMTLNKDKDVGGMMVSSVKLGALIQVISSLFNIGVGGTASWIAKEWNLKAQSMNFWGQFEIAYVLARESFMLIYVVDEFIMCIPYIWCGFLVRENQDFGRNFSLVAYLIGFINFIYFILTVVTAASAHWYIINGIIWLVLVLARIVWLFWCYLIMKKKQ